MLTDRVKGNSSAIFRPRSIVSLISFVLILSGASASAQTVSKNGTGKQVGVQLSFNGIVSSTVQLTITGSGPTTLKNTSATLSPTPAVGTIDFGTFSSLRPTTATNASAFRTTSGTAGAIVAATVIATLVYNGSTTGTITVARKTPAGSAPDVPLANLRIASPPLATWTSGTNGTQVPNAGQPGFSLCTAGGRDTTCRDGVPYDHQLAVFVPDTQQAGSFSTVVTYSGTSP